MNHPRIRPPRLLPLTILTLVLLLGAKAGHVWQAMRPALAASPSR